jgi:F0F1-type ATP synthase membrane subunit b/b'
MDIKSKVIDFLKKAAFLLLGILSLIFFKNILKKKDDDKAKEIIDKLKDTSRKTEDELIKADAILKDVKETIKESRKPKEEIITEASTSIKDKAIKAGFKKESKEV